MAVFKERLDFVRFWAEYVKNHPDQEWSRQQNLLVNSQLQTVKQFSREEYLKLKKQ